MSERVDRRNFLKGAATSAAALVSSPAAVHAQQPVLPKSATAPVLPKEADPPLLSPDVLTTDRPGSDFMVDVVKSLGFEYLPANPGSSFRRFQESRSIKHERGGTTNSIGSKRHYVSGR